MGQLNISVIIPIYNASESITKCLNSVLHQNPQAIEIICIDDCSTDNSVTIIQEFVKNYPDQIQLIKLKNNSGAPVARNEGLKISSGDYIQFLDADDYLLPNKFEHQIKLCVDNQFPDFIASAYTRIRLDGKNQFFDVKNYDDVWQSLLEGKLGCTCSNLWKREAVLNVGGFRIDFASSQEYGLMFDLLKEGAKVVYDHTSNTMILDQEVGKSISKKNPAKNWEQYLKVRIETLEYLKAKGLLDGSKKNLYYQSVFNAIRILYNFSKANSLKYFHEYIPKDFVPQIGNGTSSMYCMIYSFFGFALTEKIRSMFRIFSVKIKG